MAQDTTVPVVANTEPLTVEKAISLALGNPVYAAAGEAGLRAAEARLEAMGLLPNPELRLTYDDRWTGETGQEYAIRFSPPNPWVVGAQKAEGELGINLARIQLDGLRWSTAIETRTSFYEALHAQKLIGQADQRKTVTQEKKKLYEMLLTNGQTTLPEVLEVRLEYLEAIEQLESARQARQNAMNRLLAQTGLPTNPKPALTGEFEKPMDKIAGLQLEGLFWKYAVHHPMVSGLKLQADMAGARTEQATARNRIWFNFLQTGFSENSNWWEDKDWRFRAGIHIPIFDLRGKATEVAKAEHGALTAQVEVLRQQVRVDLAEALGNLQDAARALLESTQISDAIAAEVQETLDADTAAPEPTLPPQTRFRLKEGLQRISAAKLANAYRYQKAALQMEKFLGERLETVLNQ